jgi:hypothetical protein
MKRVITAVVLTAACVQGAAVAGSASASAATRPVVVNEPGVTAPYSVVRPSLFYLTIGPITEFRGASWSSWGANAAAGTATMYEIGFVTQNEGPARLKLYDVRNHGGTRYFSRLRVSGAKTGSGVWNWCYNLMNNFGEWQMSCP